MKNILQKLYQGNSLNKNESEKLFLNIIQKKLSSIQITAILMSMKIRGETLEEIKGAVTVILKHGKIFPRPNDLFADISGTGGDGKNTINISTMSAIVASTCNVKIIKHGNSNISSLCGSTDILKINNMTLKNNINKARTIFDKYGICFLHAPRYYEIFHYVNSIRKQIKTATIFNIIGPLINPAKPPLTLIGVYKKDLMSPMIQILKMLEYHRAIIVHCGGIDEVGLHDINYVSELNNGSIKHYTLTALDFGLNPQSIEPLFCYSKQQAYTHMKNLLQGKGHPVHEYVIAANVALLLKLFGHNDLIHNVQLALNQIRKGIPYAHLLSMLKKEI